MNILQLRQRRAQLVAQARSLVDASQARGQQTLSREDQQIFDRMFAEANDVGATIERAEMLARAESQQLTPAERHTAPATGTPTPQPERLSRADKRYSELFSRYLVEGAQFLQSHPLAAEFLGLQTDAAAKGGSFVPSETFVGEYIKGLDNAIQLRQLARVFQLSEAQSLGVPTIDTDPSDAEWTTEIGAFTADTAMATGKRSLTPHACKKLIKVSDRFLRMAPNAESIVRERIEYKTGATQESAFMTGSGVGRPLGLFTASADGIPTSRDVSTDNATTYPTIDGLKNAFYSLKAGHQANASWVFHRDVVKTIAKLKDSTNQYLWQPSVRAGEPDTLLNRPVIQSEYAPNTLTTGQYVGICGDLRYYWIVESAAAMQIKKLMELYAGTSEVGFMVDMFVDGAPVLAEAFARVKLT